MPSALMGIEKNTVWFGLFLGGSESGGNSKGRKAAHAVGHRAL